MNLANNTEVQFTVVAILVGIFTRLVLFLLKPILVFPGGIALLLSVIAGGMAGWYLFYRGKNF